ncbi:MAG: alpha/beta hydrolase [Clostridia bacterium]|nr:alpha/beta hydrolase [Clostridia bacterium]
MLNKQITISNLKISYIDEGEGEPVLILHGWGANKEMFSSVVAHLSKKYRVVVPDLPGFGESQEPPKAWCVADYGVFADEFIKTLGLKNAVWMAHSFGGRIVLKIAPWCTYAPKKIILVASAGIKPKRGPKYYVKVYSYKLAKRLLTLPGLSRFTKKAYDRFRSKAGSTDYKNASDVMRATLSLTVNEDLRGNLPKIKQSTLLVWGDCDSATPISDARLMESLLPDCGLAVLEGGTHFAFLEQNGRFLNIIDYFLEH